MTLAARLLLDLGRVQESGDDCCRPDADGHTGLDQLCAPLFAGAVDFIVFVAHSPTSMVFAADWEGA